MTVDTSLLDDLLRRMLAAGLRELEVEEGSVRIAMRLGDGLHAPSAVAATPVKVTTHAIGRFRTSHPRRPGAGVKPGDLVQAGTILGYLEIGPTLTGIVAPTGGTVAEVLVSEGQLLGYGAPVFTLNKEA